MKITLPANELLERVANVSRLIGARTILAVLTCVKIEVRKDCFTVEATNLDQWFWCDTPHEHADNVPGSCCVSAKMLCSLLGTFGKKPVTLELRAAKKGLSRLVVSEGANETGLLFVPAEEWPARPVMADVAVLHVGAMDVFAQDLAWVSKALSRGSEGTPIMSGLNVRPADGAMGATDGKRAHIAYLPEPGTGEPFTLPPEAVSCFKAMAADARAMDFYAGAASIAGGAVKIVAGQWSLISRTMEGEWPWRPLQSMLAWESQREFVRFKTEVAAVAIRSAGEFGGEAKRIAIAGDLAGVKVRASDVHVGSMEWSLGGSGLAAFECSAKFLGEFIAGNGEETELRSDGPGKPVQLRRGSRAGLLQPMLDHA